MRNSGGRTLLYTPDAQGNVSQQVNASTGAVVASYAYDASGGRTVATSDPTAASDPYAGYGGLHGYYTDWETGLQLAGLRYYDSAVGRWLNRDPISYAGGVNVYEYCGNGPVGMSDASGMAEGSSDGKAGIYLSCLLAVLTIMRNAKSATLQYAACRLFVDCGVAATGALGSLIGDTGGLVIGACIFDGIIGAMQSILDDFCDSLKHCPDGSCPYNFPSVCNLVESAIAGCLGGIMGPILGSILGGLQYWFGSDIIHFCKKHIIPNEGPWQVGN